MMTTTDVFNTPLELGVRMVFLLHAIRPRRVDLQRLIYLDYAVIYSADLGGPDSLHTPVPLRGGEHVTRRGVIEAGLLLMTMRSCIDVSATNEGILYSVGENGPALVELVRGPYASRLFERCRWVASVLADKPEAELEQTFGARGLLWGAHFLGTELVGEPP